MQSSFDFQIPVLSTLVGYLADLMRMGLQFCYEMTQQLGYPSYGIAIIVLTIIIKTLLLPFALKQIRSMKGMQELQPKLQAIQKKYKNDRVKQSEEIRKLYAENGVSPAAGCLPLLVQMPFLIAIFYALQGFPYDPHYESFLWLESLAVPDGTYTLPILSALSTFVISWQTTPANAPSNQKTMLFLMPMFIGYISLNFPSGLVIYWIVCNVYQFVQQLIMFPKESMEKVLGKKESGVVTVRYSKGEEKPAQKKRIVRKKIIKKVVKKKETASSEEEASHTSDKSQEADAQ